MKIDTYKRKHRERPNYYRVSCPTCRTEVVGGDDVICVSCKHRGNCPGEGCDGERVSSKNIDFFICHKCIKDNEWMEISKTYGGLKNE